MSDTAENARKAESKKKPSFRELIEKQKLANEKKLEEYHTTGEGKKVEDFLLDKVVMPAKKYGGETGEKIGAGTAAVAKTLYDLIREPSTEEIVASTVIGPPGSLASRTASAANKELIDDVTNVLKSDRAKNLFEKATEKYKLKKARELMDAGGDPAMRPASKESLNKLWDAALKSGKISSSYKKPETPKEWRELADFLKKLE